MCCVGCLYPSRYHTTPLHWFNAASSAVLHLTCLTSAAQCLMLQSVEVVSALFCYRGGLELILAIMQCHVLLVVGQSIWNDLPLELCSMLVATYQSSTSFSSLL